MQESERLRAKVNVMRRQRRGVRRDDSSAQKIQASVASHKEDTSLASLNLSRDDEVPKHHLKVMPSMVLLKSA